MNVMTLALAAAVAVIAWPARVQALPREDRRPVRGVRRLSSSDPEAECLQVVDALVTVLRAGSAVTPALIMALDGVGATSAGGSATSAGWQRLRLEAVRDGDVVQVWRDLGRLWRSAAFEEVAAAWQLSARHGCPLADAMEGAARSVRARCSHRACVDGATAGAKASTSVLLGLPVLGVGLGMLLGVDMLGCYSGFSGLVTLWPGIALMFVGARWSRRMTASALKAPTEAATS